MTNNEGMTKRELDFVIEVIDEQQAG